MVSLVDGKVHAMLSVEYLQNILGGIVEMKGENENEKGGVEDMPSN